MLFESLKNYLFLSLYVVRIDPNLLHKTFNNVSAMISLPLQKTETEKLESQTENINQTIELINGDDDK